MQVSALASEPSIIHKTLISVQVISVSLQKLAYWDESLTSHFIHFKHTHTQADRHRQGN